MLATLSRTLLIGSLLALPLAAQDPRCFHIPDADPTVGSCNFFPFGGGPFTYQTIVPAAELSAGAITSLGFAPCNSNTATLTNIEIRMAHSTSATLNTTFAANLMSPAGGQVVLSRPTLNWSYTGNAWSDIPLQSAFVYNGIDNLVIQVTLDNSTATPTTGSMHRDTRPRLWAQSNPAVTGSLDAAAFKLRVCMGKFWYSPSNTPTAGTCNTIPWSQTQYLYQQLVTAADLGNRAGTIRDIAFSACSAGARTFTNLTITLAHTPASTLNTTFANNLVDPPGGSVVLNGPVTYNYVANDWSNVGLTSGFAYNGVDNVVVQIQIDGGTGTSFHRDGLRPRLFASGIGPVTGSTDNAALKCRLTVDCPRAISNISPFSDGCGPIQSGLGIGRTGAPVIGASHDLLMRFGPSTGFGAFGLGFNNGPPFPQPIPGAPGCFQRNDIVGTLLTPFQPTGFSVPVPFFVPFNPILCGVRYYVQGYAFWPGINPLGVASSNQLQNVVGI